MGKPSKDGASLEILDYVTRVNRGGTRGFSRPPRTVLHQTMFFTKPDSVCLERLPIPPRQWVLEFGGKTQDIERMF